MLSVHLSPNTTHCIYWILLLKRVSLVPDLNSSMNASSKLGPPVHRALSDAAVSGLGNNIALRKNSAPDIYFCNIPNESLGCNEASSNFVLILPNHGGSSRGNLAAHIQACSSTHGHPIFVELIISVFAAPRKADMVPFAVVHTNVTISFKNKNGSCYSAYRKNVRDAL